MRFFNFIKNFIKNLFGKKECCTPKQVAPVAEPVVETPVVLQGYQGVVVTPVTVEPVEKAEVEKMSERLKDVTTSKPLTKIEPVEEKTISVKEIKARKKVVKTKSETSTETPVEKPKAKKAKKPKKD